MIVTTDNFFSFLNIINDRKLFDEIIVPRNSSYENNDKSYLGFYSKNKDIDFDSYRTVDPLKILFYTPREKVYPAGFNFKKRLIVGAKACDLNALELLDKALINSDFSDPNYYYWRKNTTIISSDCINTGPNCFCLLLDGKTYAERGFDLNLTRINENYKIEVATDKGKELLKIIETLVPLEKDLPEHHSLMNRQRQKSIDELSRKIESSFKPASINPSAFKNTELWQSEAGACISCGSCTNICPTCYCLILNDESKNKNFIKIRSYDSCQLYGYARVAGGGTPRPKLYQRFKNRVLCKFSYMKSNFKLFGCTGCGRCMEACGPESAFMKLGTSVKESTAVA
jgi:sulfhydrogenase subunit beta (sulfur reductase)